MMARHTLYLFLVPLALLGTNGALAANICWVERVKRSGTGVDVYFRDDRTVTVLRAKQQPRTFQTYSARTKQVYQIAGATVVEAVPAALGDRLFSSNTPEDSCSMTVTIHGGRIGLESNASMQIIPDQPATAQTFIPAE